MKYTGNSDGRAWSMELVTDMIKGRLPRVQPRDGAWGGQELGAPTARGKGGGRAHESELPS